MKERPNQIKTELLDHWGTDQTILDRLRGKNFEQGLVDGDTWAFQTVWVRMKMTMPIFMRELIGRYGADNNIYEPRHVETRTLDPDNLYYSFYIPNAYRPVNSDDPDIVADIDDYDRAMSTYIDALEEVVYSYGVLTEQNVSHSLREMILPRALLTTFSMEMTLYDWFKFMKHFSQENMGDALPS